MKVLLTGASGFVGAHCVKALIDAGHAVRALARTPGKVERALAPLGAPRIEVVQGDVTDRASVERAVDGCDGVLHAANVYSLDPRLGALMHETNVTGTDLVIGAAREAQCDPIVHVSSVVALLPAQGQRIDADGPVGSPTPAYSASKARAEEVARRHQAECDAVVITYPGSVFGPHDPVPGEMVHALHGFLGNRFCFRLGSAGVLQVDVRWLARVHAALFMPGQGPRRVAIGGTYLAWSGYFALLRELTGRALPLLLPTPRPLAFATGALADAIQGMVSTRLPFSSESTWLEFHLAPTDDSRAIALAGEPPPLEETVADAIRWSVEAGHVPAKWAGKLAI